MLANDSVFLREPLCCAVDRPSDVTCGVQQQCDNSACKDVLPYHADGLVINDIVTHVDSDSEFP